MLTGKKIIAIADVDTVRDQETGDTHKVVKHGSRIAANVELAGIYTQQLGQAQGMSLAYSIEVPRILYNNEKYICFDNKLYTVANMTKAKLPVNMLLNVQELDDAEILEAIEQWIA